MQVAQEPKLKINLSLKRGSTN